MKIAIGGMKKNIMEDAVKKAAPEAQTMITTDIDAARMLKKGEADYYFGACESGGGAAISILIGLVGYSKCCTVAKNGQKANFDAVKKYVDEGKTVFGMAHDGIEETVPVLMRALLEGQN